jgi:fatty-acyl-CoA synthase
MLGTTAAKPKLAARLREIRENLADLPDRMRIGAKVMRQSGMMWELTLPGMRAALASLAAAAQNPSQIFRFHAANQPNKTALVWRDRRTTFGELDARLDRLAQGLKRRGFARGSSLVLMMHNRSEFLELQGAASRVGAAAVSVSWRSTPSELAYLAGHCGARGIAFDAELWPIVERALKELPAIDARNLFAVGGEVRGCATFDELFAERADEFVQEKGIEEDAAVVIYTSGTTGKPKGAVRKFPKDALPAAMRFISETPMRCDDVHLVTCPLYHSTAFGFLALTHVLGGAGVIMDEFKPEAFLEHVERYRVTTTALVPTMLHRILSLDESILRQYDTRTLRVIFSGGAPLPGPLAIRTMDHFGDVLFNFYGATETGLVTLAKPSDLRAAPGTIGRAVPGNEIKLLDDAGHEVAVGEVGELYARNKMLVAGYHKDADATRASMREGFFSVGDLARVDRDGRYFIEGRKRDMIISGGVNVYPAEVEAALEAHADVGEVAVVGVEDPEWGERVRAFVAPKTGRTLDEGALKAWCRERLAGPKVPRDFVVLEALPRNPTGKVLKRELRARGL